MNWPWRLGMMVLAGVPAIVGGGLVWYFFEKWAAVITWEIILLFIMIFLIAKGGKEADAHH